MSIEEKIVSKRAFHVKRFQNQAGHDIRVNKVKKMIIVANILSIKPLFEEILR